MKLLRELMSSKPDKNSTTVEGVADIVDATKGEDYVELPKPSKPKKGKRKTFPTTDAAENSLIKTIWFYQNADAS